MKKTTDNAVFRYQPFSKRQKQVLSWWLPDSPYHAYDMVIAEGAIRSGKTIACIDSFLTFTLSTFEGENFILAGRTMGALKRNVLQPLFQILNAKGIPYEYNRSENFILIGTNTYYCFGANTEASQDVLQGLTAASAYADEVTLFPQSFVQQMIGRCSVEGAKIYMNCNPSNPYHYLKTDYIDKAQEKRILVLHFTMEDNYSLAEEVKDRYRRMFTGVFYQRFIEGKWTVAEGIIYDMFDEEKHVVPTQDRPYRKYYVSIDYGTHNPTTFGLWGSYRGVWYKVKEYYYDSQEEGRQKTDEEYVKDLKEFVQGARVTGYVVDPSALSFITLMKQNRMNVIPANNDVIDGIRNVQNALNNGEIAFNDCCEETFREFHSYAWDEKAGARGEDKPIKENDHAMDDMRYFIHTILYQPKARVSAVTAW